MKKAAKLFASWQFAVYSMIPVLYAGSERLTTKHPDGLLKKRTVESPLQRRKEVQNG